MAIKKCSKCSEEKCESLFSPRAEGKGIMSQCKECRKIQRKADRAARPEHFREMGRISRSKHSKDYVYERARRSHLIKNYGITLEQYNEMEAAQGGICAICGQPETSTDPRRGVRKLCVDHCHTTGEVRQLLCSLCNGGIGAFRENTEFMETAIEYLKRHAIRTRLWQP
jgi:hypothetical protein